MEPPREASPPVASGLPPGAVMDIAANICGRCWSPPPCSGRKVNPNELFVLDPAFLKLSADSRVLADVVDLLHLHSRPPLFLRSSYGVFSLIQFHSSVGSSCKIHLF